MTQFTLNLPPRAQRIGWLYLAFELLALPTILTAVFSAVGIDAPDIINFAYFLVNFLFCCWIFRSLLADSFVRFKTRPGHVILTAFTGLVAYYFLSARLNQLIWILSPDFTNANDAAVMDLIRQSPVLLLLGTCALVPLAEECLFRGLIFTPLRRRSRLAAYGLSTVAFGCVHLLGYLGTLDATGIGLSFLQYLPAGLCLAWAYDRSQSIFSPILIHSLINLMSYLTVRFLYA